MVAVPRRPARSIAYEGADMLDVLFVAVTVAFFAASLAYVTGCDRL